uniref:Cysteine protease n=1 Tax=Schistocephalus solidus TaxID=70667 RepID=A0A183TCS2_SCHSO
LDPAYLKIIKMFEDRVSALYSIHSITVMGVSEDKPIGSWLGPNTVAQVIRKLATFDVWTNLAVHVTNEDGVIVEEIKNFCQRSLDRRAYRFRSTSSDSPKGSPEIYGTPPPSQSRSSNHSPASASSTPFVLMPPSSSDFADFSLVNVEPMQPDRICAVSLPVSKDVDSDCVEIVFPPMVTLDISNEKPTQPCVNVDSSPQPSREVVGLPSVAQPKSTGDSSTRTSSNASFSSMLAELGSSPNASLGSFLSRFGTLEPFWRPLLLIVPLRLGLHDLNLSYIGALKGLFRLPQCVGILGGRPNHALWLIGYVGDSVLCLDPHTTQPAVHLGCPTPSLFSSEANLDSPTLDGSFHCEIPVRMPFQRLDPSMAVGFVCRTEADFDNLCDSLRREVLVSTSPSSLSLPLLFEIHERRPHNMPPPFSASFKLADGWTDISTRDAPTQKGSCSPK